MAQQIHIDESAIARDLHDSKDGTHEIAPDLAYQRLAIVNVMYVGQPGAGDRSWVLVDAGIPGAKRFIKSAAEKRFGAGARPAAIVMTHGHFDHVGVLEDLVAEWDAPVYAHRLEQPYLDGRAAYPPGDPSVGGGLMAALAPLYPQKPVNVGTQLRTLPSDGSIPPMPGWRWIHTPGHAPGHVSLWREVDGALIAGDAFVTTAQESAYAVAVQEPEIHGPPKYYTIDWEAAGQSVETLGLLRPDLVVTGHGRPMKGRQMTDALATLARDFARIAVPETGQYVHAPAKPEDGSAYRAP